MRALFVLSILVVLLGSCQFSEKRTSLNGTWQSIGSGWLLEIKDSTSYTFYDYTEISCLQTRQGELNELLPELQLQNDTLLLKDGVMNYAFIAINDHPKPCKLEIDFDRSQGALYNFDIFAQTVQEHYAFMDLNNINWPDLLKKQREKVLYDPTDITLYITIEETLELLNDNHRYLEADAALYEALDQIEEASDDSNETSLPELGDFQIASLVTNAFLAEDLTQDSSLISWGRLNDSLGFIQIKAMWLYADLQIPKSLIDDLGYVDAYVSSFQKMYDADYIDKEVEAVAQIMNRVMQDLDQMAAIIIDIRFNGGGQDAVTFEILSRFTDNKIQVATQKVKVKDGFSPTQSLFISGRDRAYTNPVYVLTSPQTGSAAESFALATMAMENVKRIGAPTAGAMSTSLEKKLPNGWTFALSNEVFMDNGGNNYENVGVPVDYKIDYPRDRQEFFRNVANNLEADKTAILHAVNLLND